MSYFFSVSVTSVKPATAGASLVEIVVRQVHSDAIHLARIRPEPHTKQQWPDPQKVWDETGIRGLFNRVVPLGPDELRAFVARLLGDATKRNAIRAENPVEAMIEGATGSFGFVRSVRVRSIDVLYVPAFLAVPEPEKRRFENEFEIDFAVMEAEDQPYVDIPEDELNYRFRVALEATVEGPYAAHLTAGATYVSASFV